MQQISKIIHIAIFVAICLGKSYANDFRSINYGGSCSRIIDQETSLGSEQFPGSNIIFEGLFFYKGLQLGDKAKIRYRCNKNNIFEGGSIIYEFDNNKNSNDFLLKAFEVLSNFHGEPVYNYLNEPDFGQASWNIQNINYVILDKSQILENSIIISFMQIER